MIRINRNEYKILKNYMQTLKKQHTTHHAYLFLWIAQHKNAMRDASCIIEKDVALMQQNALSMQMICKEKMLF